MRIDAVTAVRIWEDTVGDSGRPPTCQELAEYANAVVRIAAPEPVTAAQVDVDDTARARHLETAATHLTAADDSAERNDMYGFARTTMHAALATAHYTAASAHPA